MNSLITLHSDAPSRPFYQTGGSDVLTDIDSNFDSLFSWMAQVYSVTGYGGVGDGVILTDGSMTSGNASLTSASASFTNADLGKLIFVVGAGTNGSGNVLSTTIQSVSNANTVVLAVAASHTVSGARTAYGTNNSAAIASTLAAAQLVSGEVYIPTGIFLYSPSALTIPGGITLRGATREGSQLVGPGAQMALGTSYCAIRHLTLDTFNFSTQIGLYLFGANNYVFDVHFKNWGRFAVDFGYDSTNSVGTTNSYVQWCVFDHNGANQTNGGVFIAEGNYKYIYIMHNVFSGTLTNNGCAFEFYLGTPYDNAANVGAYIMYNTFLAQYGKGAYFAGREIRFIGNRIGTTVSITSGFGIESGSGTLYTRDVDVSLNTFIADTTSGSESILNLQPSYVTTDSGILNDVRIHHNHFEYGRIGAAMSTPVGGNVMTDISIENNTFLDAYTSNIFMEPDGDLLTFDGLSIKNNKFLNWRANNIGGYAAMVFSTNLAGGNINFVRSEITDNIFGNSRSGATTALDFVTAGGATVTGNIKFANNQLNGKTVTDASPSVLQYSFNNDTYNPIKSVAVGNVTGATTFNRTNGDTQIATLIGNITVALTAGNVIGDQMILKLIQDGTGSRTVTWPGNFKKAGGTLVLSTPANATDTITMRWDGTNWIEISRALNVS